MPVDPLVFALALPVAGALAGIMAGLFGIGGGALLVPVLYQTLDSLGVDHDVKMHVSVGTSLAIIAPTSIRSFMAHRATGAVDMELLRSYLFSVPVGVAAASIAAAWISGEGLRLIFVMLAAPMGIKMLLGKGNWTIGDRIPGNPVRYAIGLFIGFFSTLMGIGGGVLNNAFMTLHGRSMIQAVATSSGVGILISIPGAIGFVLAGGNLINPPPFSLGFVNLAMLLVILPVSWLTAPLGARLAHALNRRTLEIGFGIFLLLVSARFLYSLW